MTRVRVHNFSISLDGYGAGPDQTRETPLGVGGESLHAWFLPTRTFHQIMARRAVARGFHAAIVRVLAANPASLFYKRLGARRVKEGSLVLGDQPYQEIWYGWDDLRELAA
jgi:hypothetical protein